MTVTVFHAVQPVDLTRLNNPICMFLAGSIEGDTAERWQDELVKLLKSKYDSSEEIDLVILNPRRPDYDASWKPKSDQPKFCEQVNWELDSLEQSDLVVFYFDKNTKSPITLMELGKLSTIDEAYNRLLVCCDYDFWRSGNIDILCDRQRIPVLREKNDWILAILEKIDDIQQSGSNQHDTAYTPLSA